MKRSWFPLRRSWLMVTLAIAGACQGSVEETENGLPPTTTTPIKPPGTTPPGTDPAMMGTPDPTKPLPPVTPPVTMMTGVVKMLPADRAAIPACKKLDPGPSFARRLNRVEYNNTVRDLLGETMLFPGTEFPNEERRLGFDNNAEVLTVSPLLTEGYLMGAERLAGAAVDRDTGPTDTFVSRILQNCVVATAGEDVCFGRFVSSFVKRAYRRPPTPEETAILKTVYDVGKQQDFKTGIKLALTAVLQSPQFLYRIEMGEPVKAGETTVRLTQHEIATRISYLVWGTQPDTTLLGAADAKKLGTPEEIRAQVERMLVEAPPAAPAVAPMPPLPNNRARAMVDRFFDLWFETDKLLEIQKDAKMFPAAVYPASTLSSMEAELTEFLREVFWGSTAGTMTALYTAPFTFVDPPLYSYYKLTGDMPVKALMGVTKVQKVALNEADAKKRSGLLTLGGVMAVHAHENQSSPVHRGKFVREKLLCQTLPPPPNDVVIELPPVSPNFTTRERFTKHMELPACRGCHVLMDPVGLGFENYDAIGKWRDTENGKPIDASGDVVGWDNGKFKGAVDLGKKLAVSDQATQCAVTQWFRYGYGREEEATLDQAKPGPDDCSMEMIKRKFVAGGMKWRDLILAMTESDAFLYKRVSDLGGAR